MNFKEWAEKYYPNEDKEILFKMSHAWASGHVNMAHASIKEDECSCDARPKYPKNECKGFGRGGSHECCSRAGEYNGFASGPSFFDCPENCPCHD
jgi:hypothetical protein